MYTLHIPCFILVLITFVECLSLYRPLPVHPHLPIYPIKPVKPKYPVNCGPVCAIFCPNGNVRDKNGCPTCRCIPDKPNANVCSLPKVVGPCRAAFRRYFYNKKTGHCERFIYGGCGGNKNNFKTLQKCKETCGYSRGKLIRYPHVMHAY